jgi:hypothetical protein
MTDVLLPAVLVVSILILIVVVLTLLSSRRSEVLHESRYELLRDQHDRLEFLREERQMLIEELEHRSQERQQLMELGGKTPPQLVEDLEKERRRHLEAQKQIEDLKQDRLRLEQDLHLLKEQLEQERRGHLESQRLAERLEREQKEQSGISQKVERLEQERQRLTEALEREREERLGAQRQAEQQEQERTRLEGEFRSLKAELGSHKRAPTGDRAMESEAGKPWWRRPVLVVGVLFGVLVAWLASLMVALYLVSS